MLAYVFQRRFQRNLEEKAALLSAHRMMFALLQQINTIVLIQRDHIYPNLHNPLRFIAIPASPNYDTSKNVLEMQELSFLLESPKGRAVLYDLYLAQENYLEALNQWNIRSSIHLQQLQPALARSKIPQGAAVTIGEVEKELGPLVFGSMLNATDNAIESLRRAFQKLAAVKPKARAYVVERFKTNDFTDFDFPDTFGLSP